MENSSFGMLPKSSPLRTFVVWKWCILTSLLTLGNKRSPMKWYLAVRMIVIILEDDLKLKTALQAIRYEITYHMLKNLNIGNIWTVTENFFVEISINCLSRRHPLFINIAVGIKKRHTLLSTTFKLFLVCVISLKTTANYDVFALHYFGRTNSHHQW